MAARLLRRRASQAAGIALAVPLAGAAAATVGLAAVDPGFRRQCSFWWSVAPGIMEYRYSAWRHRDLSNEEYAPILLRLHERWAPVSLELILRQRGLFIKFGQVCSVRPELVPRPYRDAFRALQSEVPAEDSAAVMQVIEAELGKPLREIFSRFDVVPPLRHHSHDQNSELAGMCLRFAIPMLIVMTWSRCPWARPRSARRTQPARWTARKSASRCSIRTHGGSSWLTLTVCAC
jgi:hypothetical protein